MQSKLPYVDFFVQSLPCLAAHHFITFASLTPSLLSSLALRPPLHWPILCPFFLFSHFLQSLCPDFIPDHLPIPLSPLLLLLLLLLLTTDSFRHLLLLLPLCPSIFSSSHWLPVPLSPPLPFHWPPFVPPPSLQCSVSLPDAWFRVRQPNDWRPILSCCVVASPKGSSGHMGSYFPWNFSSWKLIQTMHSCIIRWISKT